MVRIKYEHMKNTFNYYLSDIGEVWRHNPLLNTREWYMVFSKGWGTWLNHPGLPGGLDPERGKVENYMPIDEETIFVYLMESETLNEKKYNATDLFYDKWVKYYNHNFISK